MTVSMRAALGFLGGVTVVHLTAQLMSADRLAAITQVLLMPILAAALVAGTRSPRTVLVRWTLAALFFSWLGDTLPRVANEDTGFLLMVGMFLIAQICYIVAFYPYQSQAPTARWLPRVPYLVAMFALLSWCTPGAGSLFVPVVIYAAALTMMAMLATGLGRIGGIGGALFMLSDSLIALRAFADVSLPASGFWVMLTYIVGQTMLVWSVAAKAADEHVEVAA